MAHNDEIILQKAVFIKHSNHELFTLLRNFENFHHVFDFLENVLIIDNSHSRWTANISDEHERVIWDVEITREKENEYIEWHSAANPEILHEGIAQFSHSDFHKGTKISLQLRFYFPPLPDSNHSSSMLGEDFEQRLEDNLLRFKQAIEAHKFPPPPREKKASLPEGFPTREGPFRNFL